MKNISISFGINHNDDTDSIIIFDGSLYNAALHEYGIIIRKKYNKTPIYIKPGIILKSFSKGGRTIENILNAGYPLSVIKTNKYLLDMKKEEAMCYLELNGFKRVYLDTRLEDV